MSKTESLFKYWKKFSRIVQHEKMNIVAVKLHPDAISIMQLAPTTDEWCLEHIMTWSLEQPINRSAIKDNYVYLLNQIKQIREEIGIFGMDAGISIPMKLFDTRILTLPFMTEKELVEESSIDGFWETQDPDIKDISGKIFRHQILSSEENNNIVVLLSSIDKEIVDDYIHLMIDADLLPVYIDNELCSLINGIYTRLSYEDRQKDHLIIHLCPGSHSVIGFSKKQVHIKYIQISDADEALLSVLEHVGCVDSEFWREVGLRLSQQIKKTIYSLQEEYHFPDTSNIWLVSEYNNIENVNSVLSYQTDITVHPKNALEGINIPEIYAKYVDFFNNRSVFVSILGIAIQGIKVSEHDMQHMRFLELNFLPHVDNIRKSRQLSIFNKFLVWLIGVIIVTALLLGGVKNIPILVNSYHVLKPFDAISGEARKEQVKLQNLEEKVKELRKVNNYINGLGTSRGYTNFLKDLSELLPIEAELETLIINDNTQIIITGVSTNSTAVDIFATQLIERGLVSQAPIKQVKSGKFFRFTITAKIRNTT